MLCYLNLLAILTLSVVGCERSPTIYDINIPSAEERAENIAAKATPQQQLPLGFCDDSRRKFPDRFRESFRRGFRQGPRQGFRQGFRQ